MSIAVSVSALASFSRVCLLSDSLGNVCLAVVMTHYPSACVTVVCNTGCPDEIIAERAAGTTAGRAATSKGNEVVREQKLPLRIHISNRATEVPITPLSSLRPFLFPAPKTPELSW